jgi:hypothetical protein
LDVVVFLIVLALLAAVVALLSAPLRARRGTGGDAGASVAAGGGEDGETDATAREVEAAAEADVAALEAARDAKYRELRDAELDYRTGKLSEADWRALDEQLRTEAIDILERLDHARETGGG